MSAATSSVPRAATPAGLPAAGLLDDAAVTEILDLVRARCGVPFHGYRRAAVVRRIQNRMIGAGVATVEAYAALLREDEAEAPRLLERLTLKVSRLWRNAAAVEVVARALPARPLRAWSAGCARGEEAYTLAFLLGTRGAGWTVLGTDVDPGALEEARRARYGPEALEELPAGVARRHLAPPDPDGLRAVAAEARAGVTFARHDLLGDAPPPGGPFDLVACRNVLIYLDGPARLRVERLLLDAVAPGGLLWLGEAEWPSPSLARRLAVVDRRARLFRHVGGEA